MFFERLQSSFLIFHSQILITIDFIYIYIFVIELGTIQVSFLKQSELQHDEVISALQYRLLNGRSLDPRLRYEACVDWSTNAELCKGAAHVQTSSSSSFSSSVAQKKHATELEVPNAKLPALDSKPKYSTTKACHTVGGILF